MFLLGKTSSQKLNHQFAGGIKRSTFFDTVNDRGVEQLLFVFSELQKQTAGVLPSQYAELGDLVAINGSLIDSVLSMH